MEVVSREKGELWRKDFTATLGGKHSGRGRKIHLPATPAIFRKKKKLHAEKRKKVKQIDLASLLAGGDKRGPAPGKGHVAEGQEGRSFLYLEV